MSPVEAVSVHHKNTAAVLRQFNRCVRDALIRALDIQDVVIAGRIGSERSAPHKGIRVVEITLRNLVQEKRQFSRRARRNEIPELVPRVQSGP